MNFSDRNERTTVCFLREARTSLREKKHFDGAGGQASSVWFKVRGVAMALLVLCGCADAGAAGANDERVGYPMRGFCWR